MIERDKRAQFVRIRCDVCNEPAPPTDHIAINLGLNNMGWKCFGGTHLCPAHAEDK